MMDVMTILLVYLIKVFADAPQNITLNDDLRPPASTAPDNIVPAVRVMIAITNDAANGSTGDALQSEANSGRRT